MFLTAVIVLAIAALFFWYTNTRIPAPANVKGFINIVLALVVVGAILWIINTYVPMAHSIKAILNIVVVVAVCVWILQAVGLWSGLVAMWNDLTRRRHINP